eukprot:798341-Rhodomonas_salina.2
MSGTGLAYQPMQCPVLGARISLCNVRYWLSVSAYAMSGTGLAYQPMRCPVLGELSVAGYAMSGTGIPYVCRAMCFAVRCTTR